CVCTSCHTW
nr:immunoglobulin heavy chain junction region [Homo sapiens]MOO47176.1 immunoglobulin heavy chain junction region [Homo sapiens]